MRARDRVYDDQAVNGMATSGMQARLDELLYQGLLRRAGARRSLRGEASGQQAGPGHARRDEMYRQFVEQGGQETDGAMRDAHHALDHDANAASDADGRASERASAAS